MGEEKAGRRRGRRRGRGQRQQSPTAPGQEGQETPTEITEESDARGILPFRLRLWGRSRQRPGDDARQREGREERPAAGAPAEVSPLSFWRRGRARTQRKQPMPRQTLGRTLRRIRGLYFPPWVPVLVIMFVVFGILGALFFVRGAAGAPRVGDHWHSTYQIYICGRRQPNLANWGDGKTHDDGVIHTHPNTPNVDEGAGSRLIKWFGYGGGKLTQTEMRLPGSREEYKSGDKCDGGSEAVLQVFVNGGKLTNWKRYIPQDGDRVRIIFGPEQETEDVEAISTPIPENEAVRTVALEVTDTGGDDSTTAFKPESMELRPGEAIMLVVKNTGGISHMVRVAGPDGEYDTGDDFLAKTPDGSAILESGEEGTVVIRFDEEGEFEFKDPTVVPQVSGTLVVAGEPFEGGPNAPQPVDVTLDVAMGHTFFEPSELEVEVGQRFRINLTNTGDFVHNLRIAGPDGEYRTEDDLVSTPSPLGVGETGELVGQFDKPGVYEFRSDFPQHGEMVGTITVR